MGSYKRLIFDGFRRLSGSSFSSESKILKNEIKNRNFVGRRPRWYGYRYRNYVWTLGGLVGFGGMVYQYHRNNLETVVYSKRRRFMMVSPHREKEISNYYFKTIKSTEYKGKILGSDHPDHIRVEKVGGKVLEGLRKGLCNRLEDDDERDRLIALLDEYDWEFLVVDEPTIDIATCFLAGKIIFFTGVLKHLQNDVEIALTLGHEVAHVIARHHAELMSKILWWPLYWFGTEDESCHFIWHPTSRRLDLEAYHIGFFISACAGYDPWEMLKVLTEYMKWSDSSTHPYWGTILKQVSQATVMEEALTLYKQALKDKDLHDKEKEVISIFQKLLGKQISNFILSDKKYIFTDFNNKFISRCRCRCSASPRSHPFI